MTSIAATTNTEENTTSNKCNELAARLGEFSIPGDLSPAKSAKLLLKEQKKIEREEKRAQRIANMTPEKRLTLENRKAERETFKALPIQERKAIKEEKKKTRQQKKVERLDKRLKNQQAKEERLAKMSPDKRLSLEQKKAKRQAERETFKALPIEERKAINEQNKKEREIKKLVRQKAKEERIAKMSPEKRQIFLEKKAKKEAFKTLPLEERKAIKEEKKLQRQENKDRMAYLSENWSQNIPENNELIIVDGNNVRGGGPQRLSRNDVIDYLAKYQNLNPGTKMICVFDHKPSTCKNLPGIKIKFSNDIIADDLIVQIAEQNVEKSYLVITCDRGLALRILDLNGKVMRNKEFLKLCV